jgi:hypothetical protein
MWYACVELSVLSFYDPQVRMIDGLHLASSKDLPGGNYKSQLIVSVKKMFLGREVLGKSTKEFFQMEQRLL